MSLKVIGIEHLIITRFSFRGKNAFRKHRSAIDSLWKKYADPLSITKLDHRFEIFEITCLPSILCQEQQDFKWILIIDKDLPEYYRKKLAGLISNREKSYLYIYDETYDLEEINWLEQYFETKPTYILSTSLDDDDIVPSNFTAVVHQHLKQLSQSNRLPPFKTFAAKNILQWDMIFTNKAPYGWISDWHRKVKTVSCGFSLLSKYPAYNFSVMGLEHAFAENYFNLYQSPLSENVKINRELFCVEEEISEALKNNLQIDELFFDFSIKTGPVLMVNHTQNVQVWRLHEKKLNCRKLTKTSNLGNLNISWKKMEQYASSFSKRQALSNLLHTYLNPKYNRIKNKSRIISALEFLKMYYRLLSQ